VSIFVKALIILSLAIGLYTTLIFIRIVLTWFPATRYGRLYRILSRITDPFLYLFSGLKFLHVGSMDFSPIAAFAMLAICGNVVNVLVVNRGKISVGIIASIGLTVISSALMFLFGVFAFLTGLRLAGYIIKADTYSSPFWRSIDMISAPIIYRITRIYFPRRVVRYETTLIVTLITLGAAIGGLSVLSYYGGRFLTAI
jgi:YggT family protein